jgi:hypothetical protein
MHPAHYPTQHGTRTPWCKATPHAATGNRQALTSASAAADLTDFTAQLSEKVTLR